MGTERLRIAYIEELSSAAVSPTSHQSNKGTSSVLQNWGVHFMDSKDIHLSINDRK